GTFSGSPLYMAPEQGSSVHEPDARSDIYSLGATAYYLLTARPPFEGRNVVEVLIAHAHDPIVPPSRIRPAVPTDLEQVILRCLSKQPDERFADALTLEEALAGCQDADRWTDAEAARWWEATEMGKTPEAGSGTNGTTPST